jgi:hypothetical protein
MLLFLVEEENHSYHQQKIILGKNKFLVKIIKIKIKTKKKKKEK